MNATVLNTKSYIPNLSLPLPVYMGKDNIPLNYGKSSEDFTDNRYYYAVFIHKLFNPCWIIRLHHYCKGGFIIIKKTVIIHQQLLPAAFLPPSIIIFSPFIN